MSWQEAHTTKLYLCKWWLCIATAAVKSMKTLTFGNVLLNTPFPVAIEPVLVLFEIMSGKKNNNNN